MIVPISSAWYSDAYWDAADLSGDEPHGMWTDLGGYTLAKACMALPCGGSLYARLFGVDVHRLHGDALVIHRLSASTDLSDDGDARDAPAGTGPIRSVIDRLETMDIQCKAAVLLGDACASLPDRYPFVPLRRSLYDAVAAAYLQSRRLGDLTGSDPDELIDRWAFPDGRRSQRETDERRGYGHRSCRRGPLRLPRVRGRDHPWHRRSGSP